MTGVLGSWSFWWQWSFACRLLKRCWLSSFSSKSFFSLCIELVNEVGHFRAMIFPRVFRLEENFITRQRVGKHWSAILLDDSVWGSRVLTTVSTRIWNGKFDLHTCKTVVGVTRWETQQQTKTSLRANLKEAITHRNSKCFAVSVSQCCDFFELLSIY